MKEQKFLKSPCGKFDLSKLNELELRYWRMIYPKSGVLFLVSEPGIAKSQIMKSISKKVTYIETGESLKYIDLRLSQLDETDVGLFPTIWEAEYEKDGKIVKERFLDHVVPRWANIANKQPTLIHFEELNRSHLAVRNAALQILLDREIGYDFKFNDNVFMCSTGNLGDEDGTDVEEFDSALNTRLITYKHTLSFEQWCDGFANQYVQDIIIRYLTAHPDHYYISKNQRKDKVRSFASPRTWTFISDYITSNYGFNSKIENWIDDIKNISSAYIGHISTSFLRYLSDILKIGIDDIINRYPQLKSEKVEFSRDKKSELLLDLKSVNILTLKPNQIENIKLFMLDLSDDEASSYLLHLVDHIYEYDEDDIKDRKSNEFILKFMQDNRFSKFNGKITNYLENNDKNKI